MTEPAQTNQQVTEAPAEKPPWEKGWKDVAKDAGTYKEPTVPKEEEDGFILSTIKKLPPWMRDWVDVARDVKTTPPPAPKEPQISIPKYMSKLESVESSGNASAQAKTSSAKGLHQFTADTWTDMVDRLGLPYTLADRNDPAKSRKVFEEFTKINLEKAKKDLGRVPDMAELYLYHFVRNSAPKLINAPSEAPAVNYVTKAQASANKNVFYSKSGAARSVGEILNRFRKKFQ